MTPSILIVMTREHNFFTQPSRALTAQCLSIVCVFISCWCLGKNISLTVTIL